MVGKPKRTKPAGGHNRCWIWGRHAVIETLRAQRWIPMEIHVLDEIDAEWKVEVREISRRLGVAVITTNTTALQKLTGASDHQGVIAKMPAYPYADEDTVVDSLSDSDRVLILCGIQDPHNFGSILRSADLFGFGAVFVPRRGQAAVSPHVARSSVGAVNYLQIVQCESLETTCQRLKEVGFSIITATERGEVPLDRLESDGAAAVLIGNEGTGIPDELLRIADVRTRIPISGHVGSLNAAVAAGILCYELRKHLDDAVDR